MRTEGRVRCEMIVADCSHYALVRFSSFPMGRATIVSKALKREHQHRYTCMRHSGLTPAL